LIPYGVKGQEPNTETQRYVWFDNLLGQTNSGIFKGLHYVNAYRVVNDAHQFLITSDFVLGSVTYYDQGYFDIPLRYDVYRDDLLVVNNELANRPIMLFDKKGVSEFAIAGNSFEYIPSKKPNEEVSGFFEVLLRKDSLTLYKKHKKKVFKRTDTQVLYYEFKNYYYYLLKVNDSYFTFKKAKELNRIFPKLRKELKAIDRKYSSLKKDSADDYIKAVLTDLYLLQAKTEQEGL